MQPGTHLQIVHSRDHRTAPGRAARWRRGHYGGVAPLCGFRFLQVGGGPTTRRAGTLLARLGAEVVAVLDPAEARRVLAAPDATHAAGRLVLAVALDASLLPLLDRLPVSGTLDGTGLLPPGPRVVGVDEGRAGRRGWERSGVMGLTGPSNGPACPAPGDQAAGLAAAAAVIALLSGLGSGPRVCLDGPALAGERAALAGLTRQGRRSVGGTCRLLPSADGWVAVNLARPSDHELLAAWIGRTIHGDPWPTVARHVAGQPGWSAVATAQELGLPAGLGATPEDAADDEQARARCQSFPMAPFLDSGRPSRVRPAAALDSLDRLGQVSARARPVTDALVVDLSALWAGPLATSILQAAGAEVVKVESTRRPDGARLGQPAFFDLLNAGKRSVALDFTEPGDRARLGALMDRADLVVEASRPRALEQLGLHPDTWIDRHAGGSWIAITAYGRTGPWRQWSGFGDDTAVAGGLTAYAGGRSGDPLFCGDAFGDPATGLHAAVVALAALVGSGGFFDVALREVVNHLLAEGDGDAPIGGDRIAVAPPRARAPRGVAPALGQDNARLATLGAPRR